jgi:hypothetical protein
MGLRPSFSRRTMRIVRPTELLQTGTLNLVLDRAFTLSETSQAMGHVGPGHARGKIALTI